MSRAAIAVILGFPLLAGAGMLEQQRQFERFRGAEQHCAELAKALFSSKGLSCERAEVFLRVFKHEGVIELWARAKGVDTCILVRSYAICASSGDLGPKRQQGDGQVPEGAYVISRFNPMSNFHMSLGLNYPNRSDEILGVKGRLGGDIFIHGNCVTIGCMPITDRFIEELYLICVYAQQNGQQRIPVHIFPTHLNNEGMVLLRKAYTEGELIDFWNNLREVYLAFEGTHRVPVVTVDAKGKYVVTSSDAHEAHR